LESTTRNKENQPDEADGPAKVKKKESGGEKGELGNAEEKNSCLK